MDKTININLGGSLFQVDEEAFYVLRDYIQAINNRLRNVPGGPESIEDIESRIAEIFRSQKGLAGVITKQNVDEMISTIGKPEDFDADNVADEPKEKSFSKRLYRNPEDMVISGVCGGIGAYLNIDPVLFRILFVFATLFGGAGILIYVVFWIAVPKADTDARKREMYGSSYYARRNPDGTASYRNASSGLSNGVNEVIGAIGKVFYIIFRIFLVFIGTVLLITGFLSILTYLMVFVFRIPEAFTHHGLDFSFNYLPDMLPYIFSAAAAPWIWGLATIVFILPMIALIYWGVRMIFWFSVRDAIFNVVMLLVWVLSLATLSIFLFNEGISFAETSTSASRNILTQKPDTLYVVAGRKVDDISFEKEFMSIDDDYAFFMVDSARNIYLNPRLRFGLSEENNTEIEVRKRSSGKTRREANNNADKIIYNYEVSGDTLRLDEYFTIPAGKKWTADFVTVNVSLPENTVIYFDRLSAGLMGNRIHIDGHNNEWEYSDRDPGRLGGRYWMITEDGLTEVGRKSKDQK